MLFKVFKSLWHLTYSVSYTVKVGRNKSLDWTKAILFRHAFTGSPFRSISPIYGFKCPASVDTKADFPDPTSYKMRTLYMYRYVTIIMLDLYIFIVMKINKFPLAQTLKTHHTI